MGEKIIFCRCIFGGYDLCDCGGSGVIIQHEDDDYKPARNSLPNPNSIPPTKILSLTRWRS
jgi:hypothetical protein